MGYNTLCGDYTWSPEILRPRQPLMICRVRRCSKWHLREALRTTIVPSHVRWISIPLCRTNLIGSELSCRHLQAHLLILLLLLLLHVRHLHLFFLFTVLPYRVLPLSFCALLTTTCLNIHFIELSALVEPSFLVIASMPNFFRVFLWEFMVAIMQIVVSVVVLLSSLTHFNYYILYQAK